MNNAVTENNSNKTEATQTGGTPLLSRLEVLEKLSDCITLVHTKIKKGRTRKGDKDRQTMLKTLGYLTSVHLAGIKDMELDELEKRIAALEEQKTREMERVRE